jgi:CheY-like chemotaxis protein
MRILVVDDDRDALTMIAQTLSVADAQVVTVESAADALDRLRASAFDVILSDLGMPQTDGFDFIAQVRRLPDEAVRQIPAAALTAFARSEDRVKALRAGFQMHLAKPVDPGELLAAVAALVRR